MLWYANLLNWRIFWLEGRNKKGTAWAPFLLIEAQCFTSLIHRRALQNKSGGILVEGVYPDGEEAFYGLGW